MDFLALAKDGGGWLVAVALVVGVARALMSGDLVLGREFASLKTLLDEKTEQAEALITEQRAVAERERTMMAERIESQRKIIEALRGEASP